MKMLCNKKKKEFDSADYFMQKASAASASDLSLSDSW